MRDLQMSGGLVAQHFDALDVFAEFMRIDVAWGDASPETIRAYYGQVARFVDWCEENGIRPAVATAADVKAYRGHMIEQGLARTTITARLNAVRRFYAMAVANGWRTDNPVEGVKAPPDRTDRAERVKWLPLMAIQRLLQAPDCQTAQGKRDKAILALMALHGLRVMEVASLDVGDVDLETNEVRVLGKGKKRRTILLVEQSIDVLRAWLEIREVKEGETALFVSLHHPRKGTQMSRRAIRKRVDFYLESLGLKREGVSCHSLRHSFATLSRAAGAKLDAIGMALGHASVTTTQVYADIVSKAAENPAKFLVGALEEIG